MTRDHLYITIGCIAYVCVVVFLSGCAERSNYWNALGYGVPQRTDGPHNY